MKDMLSQVLIFLRHQDAYSKKEQAFLRKQMMKECDDLLKSYEDRFNGRIRDFSANDDSEDL